MKPSLSKNNLPSWQKAFGALPADHQHVLYFLAIYAAPIRKIRIQECCAAFEGTPNSPTGKASSTEKNIAQLEQHGWIEKTAEGRFQCKSDRREWIVQRLYAAGQYQKFATVLFSVSGGRYFVNSYSYPRIEKKSWDRPKLPADIVRELRHLLLINDINNLSELLHYPEQLEPERKKAFYQEIWNLFAPQDGFTWLSKAKIEFRCQLFQYLLVRSLTQFESNFDEVWNVLVETGCDPKCDLMTQVLILDYALCAGKLDNLGLSNFSGKAAPVLYFAHKSFADGQYFEAVVQYRLALKSFGNLKAAKNAVLPCFSGIFHALAELNIGNRSTVLENAKATIERIDRANRKTIDAMPLLMEKCWKQIETIAQRLMGHPPNQHTVNPGYPHTKRPFWLVFLLSAYESKWFELALAPGVGEAMIKMLRQTETGFPWLAAEAAEVCQSLSIGEAILDPPLKKATQFRKQTKTKPLRDLIAPKENWELWLESLQALINEPPTETKKRIIKKEQLKTRLIWHVHDVYGRLKFVPCEQKCLASGIWREPKPITMVQLFKTMNQFDYLTEQDKIICAKMRMGRYEYSFPDDIALEFVGHPLLFSQPDYKTKNSVRIELIHAKPEIAMEDKEGQLHVTFSPPLLRRGHTVGNGKYEVYYEDSNQNFFTIKESPTRYKVVKLTKTEMQLRLLLGDKGCTFPKKAQGALTTLLGKLAGDMSVKTDAKVEFADIPSIPVDPKLYIYLSPSGEGIQADFFTRPLGPDSPGHRPGVGSERLIGEVDGRNVQTVRNLTSEKQLRDEIIAKVPSFQNAVLLSNDQHVFETPNDALSLLAELKDLQREEKFAESFEIYWPHGEKYSVTSTASFGNFELSFSSAEDWLAATGSLKVDGNVFELQKLFELLNENPESRFIKLSEQKFLALTNEFRKRLGELHRLSQIKGKTVQLHPLAAAGMEDFFDVIPSLQKNAIWNDVKKRIEAARDYKAPFPKSFVGDMRDYQLDGYDWLARSAKWGVGCCLADDMGLGKTIQALALLLLRADEGPALVVAPTSVCFNWEREAEKFAPSLKIKRIQSITTGANAKAERDKLIASAKKRDVLITSYTLLQQEIELFAKKKYATVILDESQAIKNPESNRAKATFTLQADVRLAMTGTPIENRLTELWSLFRFLNPGLFGSQKSFEDRFAFPIQRDQSASARSTLRRLVHPFILRRTKSQVSNAL